ncbi:hypothetical protein [Streptomyces sp. NPDC015125]|uniref:hypothetical protein n=1 Tax=Streptomyces sp. NPDC015125 TaxID=3364938 RepID=UPI0036FA6DC0
MLLESARNSYNCVDASDVDRFIEFQYGRPYSVARAVDSLDHDTLHIAELVLTHPAHVSDGEVVPRPGVGPEALAEIKAWQNGTAPEPTPELLLSDLASRALIPAGDYLIDICL